MNSLAYTLLVLALNSPRTTSKGFNREIFKAGTIPETNEIKAAAPKTNSILPGVREPFRSRWVPKKDSKGDSRALANAKAKRTEEKHIRKDSRTNWSNTWSRELPKSFFMETSLALKLAWAMVRLMSFPTARTKMIKTMKESTNIRDLLEFLVPLPILGLKYSSLSGVNSTRSAQ